MWTDLSNVLSGIMCIDQAMETFNPSMNFIYIYEYQAFTADKQQTEIFQKQPIFNEEQNFKKNILNQLSIYRQ